MMEELLRKQWKIIERTFNYPAIREPEIVEHIPGRNDTAYFNFYERKQIISRSLIESLKPAFQPAESLEIIVKHETGHWTFFPRELSMHLCFLAEADRAGNKASALYPWYADIVDEENILNSGLGGGEYYRMREHLAVLADGKGKQNSATLNRLLAALYSELFRFRHKPVLSKLEQEYFGKIKDIPFLGLSFSEHLASFYLFYKALEGLVLEEPELGAQGGLGSADISEISVDELNRVLSKILSKEGAGEYKEVRKYLEKVRPDFSDPFENKDSSGKRAGFGTANFKNNDELIPFYKRWASGHGIYIARKPIVKDATSIFRSGKKEYESGEPMHKIDIFGSRGFVGVPGISKLHLEEEGTVPSTAWEVPHALIGIDSSGSMDHPAKKSGAIQVLAAAIIGENYHANGAYVGGWNFSVNLEFLSPSRSLEQFYSLICGYWGGGTVINHEKLYNFLRRMKFGHENERHLWDREISKPLSELLSPEENREFIDKSLQLNLEAIRVKCSKLDNILITDGYIANAKEVMSYLSALGKITRNYIFLSSKDKYEEWASIGIPNTSVYYTEKPSNLIGLALNQGRTIKDRAV